MFNTETDKTPNGLTVTVVILTGGYRQLIMWLELGFYRKKAQKKAEKKQIYHYLWLLYTSGQFIFTTFHADSLKLHCCSKNFFLHKSAIFLLQ